jgi:hypothetical protein
MSGTFIYGKILSEKSAELGAFDGNFIVFGNIFFPVLAAEWLH